MSHFYADFNEGLQGNCARLLRRVAQGQREGASPDERYYTHILLAEMHDRAVCVPFDPAIAFQHFEVAAESHPVFHFFTGWKYAFGHGVAPSTERANRDFKHYVIGTGSSSQHDLKAYLSRHTLHRSSHPLLEKGIDWITTLRQSDEATTELMLQLIDGGGTYFDGSTLDSIRASHTSSRWAESYAFAVREYLPGRFEWGRAVFEERYAFRAVADGKLDIRTAGICGYQPAIHYMITAYLEGRTHLEKAPSSAFAWYVHGTNLGMIFSETEQKSFETLSPWMKRYGRMEAEGLSPQTSACP